MRTDQAPVISRLAYAAPAFSIDHVHLEFDLDPERTRVKSRMQVRRNPGAAADAALHLDGEDITLQSLTVDGRAYVYAQAGGGIRLDKLPERCEIELVNTCAPASNTHLSGLYMSGGAFFTQCEAEGFRRITFWPDRPDVMSRFTVVLRADAARFPVLLSNGNLQQQLRLDDGRLQATWEDPFPKPCYLFALVAARLVSRQRRVRSRDGREHVLEVFVREGDLDKTEHALQSLVLAQAWDEQRFGLSLDLDRFMIVAVSDFNMGAMENKGLNIFNTKYVLANPATATDTDFQHIESVVGHEYFHNWTGNRITCRDWFQLSLKEGLTVFRDQEFSQDLAAAAGGESARAVRRIEDVRTLRAMQFPEDAGPMAHPVRPDSYVAIDNFYTATVYEKGAEVVRMMQTLVGREGFARGMREYFARHDGQAVTCDDFLGAMADANPDSELARRREVFARWYAQAGTPRLRAHGSYDEASRSYTLRLEQICPPSPGQADKQAQLIPLRMGLLDRDGGVLRMRLDGAPASDEVLLVLGEDQQTFTLHDVERAPVPSLLRGFSAPVILECASAPEDLALLLQHDADGFNRWEAGQHLAADAFRTAHAGSAHNAALAAWTGALKALFARADFDDEALLAELLDAPAVSELEALVEPHDPDAVDAARRQLERALARALSATTLAARYAALHAAELGVHDARAPARRRLKRRVLELWVLVDRAAALAAAEDQFAQASGMSERLAALRVLTRHADTAARAAALAAFRARHAQQPLVLDMWFAVQAEVPGGATLDTVRALLSDAAFTLRNPNRVQALLGTFARQNRTGFHRVDGAGYALMVEQLRALDALNPQTAARIAQVFNGWARLEPKRRALAEAQLRALATTPGLSRNLADIVQRSLV